MHKFPFGDSLMTFDLEILLPGKLKPDTALSLTKHFPQLHIFDSESHDKLRDECMDCVLSPSDLPKPMECTTAEETEKLLVGSWEKLYPSIKC